MVERPILFSGPMVRALLDGRKTMTRRVANRGEEFRSTLENGGTCPYGEPGDRLYVREAWHTDEPDLQRARAMHEDMMSPSPIYYRADPINEGAGCVWRPSIHMPRWASRILLEITATRLEKLQKISEEDAASEGIEPMPGSFYWFLDCLDKHDMPAYLSLVESFRSLWQSINGIDSWDKNPLVWVIEFRRIE